MTEDRPGPVVPDPYDAMVVSKSLACRGCDYDLRGLRSVGVCPECSLDVWRSVLKSIDETAPWRGALRNPRAVGDGLLLIVGGMLASAALLFVYAVRARLLLWRGNAGVLSHLPDMPDLMLLIFGLIACIGAVLLKPRGGARWSLMLGVTPLIVGTLGWSTIWFVTTIRDGASLRAISNPLTICLMLLMVLLVFAGLRHVFSIIGQRSVAYRRSKSGKQGLESMTVALLAGMIGECIRQLAIRDLLPSTVGSVGTAVRWVCALMLLVGFVYLFVNAWWIRREILAPRPGFNDVLEKPRKDQTVVDEPETFFEVQGDRGHIAAPKPPEASESSAD
ncbi:MAG: hypothetical protein AAF432_03415 [Planctomycetota bacterium]